VVKFSAPGPSVLVARQHQLDFRAAQGFDYGEIFFAGDSKDALHTFILQRGHQQVRTFAMHGR
jgi:hypothetical protein